MIIGINVSFARKPYAGMGQVTLNFVRELARQAAENKERRYILYAEEPLPAHIALPENVRVKVIESSWKRDDLIRKIWWEKYLLPRMVRRDGCDALLSLYQCPTIAPAGVRHVMVVHDLIPKLFPQLVDNARKKLYQLLTEKAIVSADKIVAVSKWTARDLREHLRVEEAKIVVQTIDVDPLFKKKISRERSLVTLQRYGLKPGYIYHGGGLEMRKNTEGVLLAYQLLVKRYKQEGRLGHLPRLVISGKLMPELAPLVTDVEQLVKDLDLTPYVRVIGYVPQAHLPALYAYASVFVFPSKYEGFGLPVLEAMSMGVPTITARTSSLPEVGGDAVLYVDPEDVTGMAMRIGEVLDDHALRERLRIAGQERSRQFSWEGFVSHVVQIL